MKPPITRDERGVVMMEFMLAVFPVMIAFLAVVQFCFLGVGKLMVRHAATCAARAAVVVVEESEEVRGVPQGIYGGEQAGEVIAAGQAQSSQSSGVSPSSNIVGGRLQMPNIPQPTPSAGSDGSSLSEAFQALSSLGSIFEGRDATRIDQIRTAAYIPMLGISPNAVGLAGAALRVANPELAVFVGMNTETVEDAIGGRGYLRLAGALLYSLGMLAVSFPEAPGSQEYKEGVIPLNTQTRDEGEDDEETVLVSTPLTVRVSYLFRCMVPIAAVLICESGPSLAEGVDSVARTFWNARRTTGHGVPADPRALEAFMSTFNEAQKERDQNAAKRKEFEERKPEFDNVEDPEIQLLLLMIPASRYFLMTADATLPLQAARYYDRKKS